MKILYISSFHAVLEADELTVLTELGHSWFSTGHYLNPQHPLQQHSLRGPKPDIEPDLNLISEFNILNPNYKIHGPVYVNKVFADKFDIVIVEHCNPYPYFLRDNWEAIKHKPVIWRTYGQQQDWVETMTLPYKKAGVKMVRVSKNESRIPNYCGADAIIVGYVDETRYSGWTGAGNFVLTFNNMFANRSYHSNTQAYLRLRSRFNNFKLYGLYNENVPINLGVLSQTEQEQAYKDCGVYFALGSKPAPLTYNFQEALMAGCPLVTWGPRLGNGSPPMYEIPDIIENGVDGFYSDIEDELFLFIDMLLNNKALATQVSAKAREKAVKLYSKDVNKQLWKKIIEEAAGR